MVLVDPVTEGVEARQCTLHSSVERVLQGTMRSRKATTRLATLGLSRIAVHNSPTVAVSARRRAVRIGVLPRAADLCIAG